MAWSINLGIGGSGFQPKKTFKNLLLQSRNAQMLEIWCEALPGGPVPSLQKMAAPGSKTALRHGFGFESKIYLKSFFSCPELLGALLEIWYEALLCHSKPSLFK